MEAVSCCWTALCLYSPLDIPQDPLVAEESMDLPPAKHPLSLQHSCYLTGPQPAPIPTLTFQILALLLKKVETFNLILAFSLSESHNMSNLTSYTLWSRRRVGAFSDRIHQTVPD